MLCDKCKQREAVIDVTQYVDGREENFHLCPQCARESELGRIFERGILNQMLAGIFGMNEEDVREDEEESNAYAQIVCPTCGMSYGDFVRNSRFGCEDCYQTFGLLMEDSITEIQGSARHTGKVPRYQDVDVDDVSGKEIDGDNVRGRAVGNAGENMSDLSQGIDIDDIAQMTGGYTESADETNTTDEINPKFTGASGSEISKESETKTESEAHAGLPADPKSSGADVSDTYPGGIRTESLAILKERLSEALAEEDYEAAAHYRDRIREWEKEENGQ